eukprot:TRINITY_DN1756_c0_g1_i1.p1 TRINITY_DN1756_c0_g1~~TRINITY_DN1756_c0_g1_i1.p1  ORF type:complete len:264 (-),score=45.02 TRINITY_DN1756_c0_g1_i1:73-864(-)
MSANLIQAWGRTSSSNTQKVLWMLKEIQAPYELIPASARLGANSQHLCEITGGKPFGVVDTPEYAQMCPTQKIPTLKDGETTIWESHSILRYLAQTYCPQLHLDSAAGMAMCSPWMDWHLASDFNMACNHHFVDQMARTPADKRDFTVAAEAYKGYVDRLLLAEKRLEETKAFLAGSQFTVADIPLGVELARLSCCLENWRLSNEKGDAPPVPQAPNYPALCGFFQRLQSRPAFLEGCLWPEQEHHDLELSKAEALSLFGRSL